MTTPPPGADLTVPALLAQLTVRALVLGPMLVGPVVWLADGHGLADLDLAPLEWVLASSQVLLAAAVLVAIGSMFAPRSHAWFAARPTEATSAPAAMIGASR